MFERLEEKVSHSRAHILRYSLYRDGKIDSQERVATYPGSNCYSISKNVTATAVGIAYDRGLFSLEDPMVSFFPPELWENGDPRLQQVTIRHLLTQTMGIAQGFLFEKDRYTHGTDDFLAVALSAALPFAPGEKFVYSNSTFYLLARIVEQVSGMPMDLFVQQNLFSPMGINTFAWERCPKGHAMGATGLYLRTEDMLRLGMLYLHKGVFGGKRIFSEAWAQMATQTPPEGGGLPTAFSFWFNELGYHGSGAYGQALIVWPQKEIVLAAHSFEPTADVSKILLEYLREEYP